MLNEFERRLPGFESMRTVYEKVVLNPNVDDIRLSRLIEDSYFATVVACVRGCLTSSPVGEIRIADDKYIISKEGVTKVSGQKSEFFSYRASAGSCENSGTQTYCEKKLYGGDEYQVRGTKWNRNFVCYKSIGVRTNSYKRNDKGNWKKHEVDEVHLFIDQWAKLRWYLSLDPLNIKTVTNYKKTAEDAKEVEKVFDVFINTPGSVHFYTAQFCVPENGRFHHWTYNFNDDCHCEAW